MLKRKMQGTIVSFRRGRHTYRPRQFIVSVGNVTSKQEAAKLLQKKIVWRSPQGKEIEGRITALHGSKGLVRAIFERGLPGQAITSKVEIG